MCFGKGRIQIKTFSHIFLTNTQTGFYNLLKERKKQKIDRKPSKNGNTNPKTKTQISKTRTKTIQENATTEREKKMDTGTTRHF